MAEDEPREHAELGRFWDEVVRGVPVTSDGLNPTLTETVLRLHALDNLPGPDPAFAQRAWRQLQVTHDSTSILVIPVPELSAVNGRVWDGEQKPSDRPRSPESGRVPTPVRSTDRVGASRFRPLLEVMAAVLLLGLIGGYAAGSWLLPQLAGRWQRAAVLEAPVSRGVPMFRGDPARTGVMPGPGPAGEPRLLWRFPPPSSTWRLYDSAYYPSPAVAGGVVYLGHPDGTVSAVNALTGVTRWQVSMGGAVTATPAVVHGTVYIGSADGHLYALDAASGAERWRQEVDPLWASPVVTNGVAYVTTGEAQAAPAVDEDTVYVGGGFGDDLVAVDAATGEERWRFPLRSAGLYAVDAVSGQPQWHFATERGVNSAAAVADGIVYVGDLDQRLYAVEATTGRKRWSVQIGQDANPSETRESIRTPNPAPAVVGGVVYAGGSDGTLVAIDAASGVERWQAQLGTGFISAPVLAGGVVYVGQMDGTLFAVDAATGKTRWTQRVDAPIGGPPAVVDGIVYVATTVGALIAFAD